jgi:hypothetical protein
MPFFVVLFPPLRSLLTNLQQALKYKHVELTLPDRFRLAQFHSVDSYDSLCRSAAL